MSNPICVEPGCNETGGGDWSPYWCKQHDQERMNRLSKQFAELKEQTQ